MKAPSSAVLGLALLAITSCGRNATHSRTGQNEIIAQTDALTIDYLNGSLEKARLALLKEAAILENSVALEPIGRAQLLALDYFRLFALETRSGNEDPAAAALIKAQFWSLKNGELQRVDSKKAIDDLKRFDKQHILEYVRERDRHLNDGHDPKYIAEIAPRP